MQLNHTKQRKWTDDEKQFALSLFYKSPKAYCHLRDTKYLALPCVSLIRRWVNELDLKPGKSDNLFNLLKSKTGDMTDREGECVLLWDEMSIKSWLEYNLKKDIVEGYTDMGEHGRTSEIASQVLVFMLRGRQHNWRQPICYYVSHNSVNGQLLKTIILDVLNYVKQAGFLVKSMVCDLGSPNQCAIKLLNITKEKPYIELNNEKIFFNFDVPHLIKCLRNNFRRHKLTINGKSVSWGVLRELREREKNFPCKAAPKLTDKHLDPNPFELMNVSLAAQIFSNSISAALLAGAIAPKEPLTHPDCMATADMLKKFNDLFDCLNSRSANDKNPLRRPLSANNPQVINYLKNSLDWLKTLKCVDTSNPPCFAGLSLTINSILLQWEDMERNGGQYLLTSRLQQDPIENLFAVLRGRSGHNANPTAMQLRRNLQYCITANLNSTSKLTNCKPDETEPLLAVPELDVNKDLMQSTEDQNSGVSNETPLSEPEVTKDGDLAEWFNEEFTLQNNFESDGTDAGVSSKQSDKFVDILQNDGNDDAARENVTDLNTSVVKNPLSSLENVLNKPTDCSTPYDAAVKYYAGYLAHKVVSKFNCETCRDFFTRTSNSNYEVSADLLLFFKAFKVHEGKNNLGNLCIPSDFFNKVIAIAVTIFDDNFKLISHLEKVGELLRKKITLEIADKYKEFWTCDELCKSHREFVVAFFVKVNIYFKLKWMNADARDAKKSKRVKTSANNKPNRKLQKLSHQ